MNKEEVNKLKIGDKIKINTYHCREGRLKTTRVINEIIKGMNDENLIYVRCFGWDNFRIKKEEIIEKL